LQLFNDTLKPLTISSNGASVSNNTNTTTASMTQQGQNNSTSQNANNNNNTMSNLDKLQAGLLQLRDDIDHKATPQEVMMTAHTSIHPTIMLIYGLTLEQAEGEGHTDHEEG
jgi:folate-binding Fe-S cluster repair protein YgfZ